MGSHPPAPGFFASRLYALAADRVRSYRIGKDTTSWYRDMYGAANRDGWEQTQTYMREMNRRMRERGGRFLVLIPEVRVYS